MRLAPNHTQEAPCSAAHCRELFINAAAAPVYDMAELAVDPHVIARNVVVDLEGTPMQGLVARLSETPGRLRWAGRPLGTDTEAVWNELDEP